MLKIECNSKESIIDFIESAPEHSYIHSHYSNLNIASDFKQKLLEIKKQSKAFPNETVELTSSDSSTKFVQAFKKDLEQAGISLKLKNPSKDTSHSSNAFLGYILNEEFIQELQSGKISSQNQDAFDRTFLLAMDSDLAVSLPDKLKKVPVFDFSKSNNYYSSVLKILGFILPNLNLEKDIVKFEKWSTKQGNCCPKLSVPPLLYRVKQLIKTIKKQPTAIKMTAGVLASGAIITAGMYLSSPSSHQLAYQSANVISIRDDHPTPHADILMERHEITDNLNNILSGLEAIKVAALVGVGGAGKTTLARHFSHNHDAKVVWEINAESQESLIASFEALAFELAENDSDRSDLKAIMELDKSTDRAKHLISFVKQRLQSLPGWLLVYDNLESFDTIIDYFPFDEKSWGQGQVILTSRDSNLLTNSFIPADNVIHVGALTGEQKYDLFSSILNIGNTDEREKERIVTFLKELPPFPLDISIAAHFIKETKVSYEEYLNYLAEEGSLGSDALETLSEEHTGYANSRSSILMCQPFYGHILCCYLSVFIFYW